MNYYGILSNEATGGGGNNSSSKLDVTDLQEDLVKVSGKTITFLDEVENRIYDLVAYCNDDIQKRYEGKNLLKLKDVGNYLNGVSFSTSVSGGFVSMRGTATDNIVIDIADSSSFTLEKGKSYLINGIKNINYPGVKIYGFNLKGTGESIYWNDDDDGKRFTFNADSGYSIRIEIAKGTKISNPLKFYPMIRKSSIIDSYFEPYVGGIPSPNLFYRQNLGARNNFELRATKKNRLRSWYSNITLNGLKFDGSTNGYYEISGEPTGDIECALDVYDLDFKSKYILSGNETKKRGYSIVLKLYVGDRNCEYIYCNDEKEVIVDFSKYPTLKKVESYVFVSKDAEPLNGETVYIYPMLRPYYTDGKYKYADSNNKTLSFDGHIRAVGDFHDTVYFNDDCVKLNTKIENIVLEGSDTENFVLVSESTDTCLFHLDGDILNEVTLEQTHNPDKYLRSNSFYNAVDVETIFSIDYATYSLDYRDSGYGSLYLRIPKEIASNVDELRLFLKSSKIQINHVLSEGYEQDVTPEGYTLENLKTIDGTQTYKGANIDLNLSFRYPLKYNRTYSVFKDKCFITIRDLNFSYLGSFTSNTDVNIPQDITKGTYEIFETKGDYENTIIGYSKVNDDGSIEFNLTRPAVKAYCNIQYPIA